MTEPTDAEILELASQYWHCLDETESATEIELVRAALAKWGTPPAVAGEQVDRADAVNLARNTLTQNDRAITKKGVRVLAEAVLSMDALYTTPQPTQPQAEPKSGAKSFQTYGEANAYSKGYYAGKKAATQAQAQAGAVPLTPDQVAEIADAAHREYDRLVSSGQCAPRWSAVFAHLLERAHGITEAGRARLEGKP